MKNKRINSTDTVPHQKMNNAHAISPIKKKKCVHSVRSVNVRKYHRVTHKTQLIFASLQNMQLRHEHNHTQCCTFKTPLCMGILRRVGTISSHGELHAHAIASTP